MVDKIFADRTQAGQELGKLLESEYKGRNVLVAGIPRGGIVVAYEVAKILQAQLTVVITKKLPHPDHQELAIGAVAEDGSVYVSSFARNLPESTIRHIIDEQFIEIKSRVQRFRKGNPLPIMENRIVIIVDDGIATGATLIPALKLCKKRNAAKVVVGAPVSGTNYIGEITSLADEIKIVVQPDFFYAVGQVYEDFRNASEEEVMELLDDFEHHRLTYG